MAASQFAAIQFEGAVTSLPAAIAALRSGCPGQGFFGGHKAYQRAFPAAHDNGAKLVESCRAACVKADCLRKIQILASTLQFGISPAPVLVFQPDQVLN